MHKETLDCILFSFNQKNYILPAVAFAEWGDLHEYQVEVKDFCFWILWRGLKLSLIRSDLTKESPKDAYPKFAVLNALGQDKLSYFAMLVDNRPQKLKITHEKLTWQDKNQKIAIYQTSSNEAKEVIILDLKILSRAIAIK